MSHDGSTGRRSFNTRSTVLPAVAALVTIAIFIAATVTDLEIAMSVLYVAVVLMSIGFCRRRGVILVSLGCMALTIQSYFLTRTGVEEAGLINSGLGLLAIGATAFLALKIDSAEVAAHEARAQLAHVGRVTALGELTASTAHDVNQPIAATVINGNASLRLLAADPPNLDETRVGLRGKGALSQKQKLEERADQLGIGLGTLKALDQVADLFDFAWGTEVDGGDEAIFFREARRLLDEGEAKWTAQEEVAPPLSENIDEGAFS